MTLPPVLFELKVGAVDWANVTSDILARDNVRTGRGKGDWASQASPSSCSFSLNNRAGRYSPRNPLSPLYGMIGRNTPVRVSLGKGAYGMVVNDSNGRAECADSAALSFLGDLDLRVDLEVLAGNDWTTGDFDLASQFDSSDPGRRWALILIGGKLRFQWWTNGTTGSLKQAETAVLPGPTTGRRILRVTLDVDNGAAGNTVTFYTGTTMAGPFTAIGAPIVQAGVTTLFNANSKLRIGSASATTAYTHGHTDPAVFYSAELRNGIGGTVVASPNFAGQPLDPVPFAFSEFNDTQGNTWAFVGTSDAARIWYGDVDVRFYGEMSSFPRRWDVSGNDAWVPVEAAGILRRLGQGTDPAATGLQDFIMGGAAEPADLPSPLTSYWPLSGGEGTTYSLNLGRAYNKKTKFYAEGSPLFTYGIDMGPFIGSGMELNATAGFTYSMRCDIGTGDNNAALDFVFQSLNLGRLTASLFSYSGQRWDCELNTPGDAGTLQVTYTDAEAITTAFTATGSISAIQDTGTHHLRFQILTDGSDTDYAVYVDGVLVDSGTKVGTIVDGTAVVRFYYTRTVPQTVTNLAHVTLWSDPTPALIPTAADVYDAMLGYAGETAGERMVRVAAAGGIALEIVGDPADTTLMGPQHSEGKLEQIRDAEATDLGILTEARDSPALLYRTRASMYNQTPVLTLSYSAKQISPPFEPTDDDQNTRNIITAVQRDGDSYRLEKTTGALSVQDPPNGVGPYRDEVTVNVETAAQLPLVAGWLLNLGTIDDARYPTLTVELANPNMAGLEDSVRAAEVGDLVRITNASVAGIFEDIDLLILGVEEAITTFTHTFTFNCTPAGPYNVAVYGSAVGTGPDRYDSADSTLTAGATSTATSLSVTTATVPWTTTAGEFPFDITVAGERMTVTNITSATSPQTFTVTRSVNGVVKGQSAGASVRLWSTPRYAL